ncbi:MAG: dolichyl-phosphate beta-glucosyltransferase [bacterium]
MELTVIVPAYNEARRLDNTIRDYSSFYADRDAEILVIVNGSTDNTGKIARELETSLPNVRVWETPDKLGKGGAIYQGFHLAKGDVIAFTDADDSTVPAQLDRVVEAVRSGADVALGSRWLHESVQEIRQPLSRRIASRTFNLIVRLLFGMPFRDTQCGGKAFRSTVLEPILDRAMSSGWAFDVELIWILQHYGARIVEVPIVWSDNSGSRLRMHRDGPAMLLELLRVRFKDRG